MENTSLNNHEPLFDPVFCFASSLERISNSLVKKIARHRERVTDKTWNSFANLVLGKQIRLNVESLSLDPAVSTKAT
jgi:hypothetical protein